MYPSIKKTTFFVTNIQNFVDFGSKEHSIFLKELFFFRGLFINWFSIDLRCLYTIFMEASQIEVIKITIFYRYIYFRIHILFPERLKMNKMFTNYTLIAVELSADPKCAFGLFPKFNIFLLLAIFSEKYIYFL